MCRNENVMVGEVNGIVVILYPECCMCYRPCQKIVEELITRGEPESCPEDEYEEGVGNVR